MYQFIKLIQLMIFLIQLKPHMVNQLKHLILERELTFQLLLSQKFTDQYSITELSKPKNHLFQFSKLMEIITYQLRIKKLSLLQLKESVIFQFIKLQNHWKLKNQLLLKMKVILTQLKLKEKLTFLFQLYQKFSEQLSLIKKSQKMLLIHIFLLSLL